MKNLFGAFALAALLASCGDSSTNLATLPTGTASQGITVFQSNCMSCHGSSAAGGSGPNIRGAGSDTIQSVVRSGKGSMPAFSTTTITDQSLADLIAYIDSL